MHFLFVFHLFDRRGTQKQAESAGQEPLDEIRWRTGPGHTSPVEREAAEDQRDDYHDKSAAEKGHCLVWKRRNPVIYHMRLLGICKAAWSYR